MRPVELTSQTIQSQTSASICLTPTADELGIAERTVKIHRAQLMAKLGVHSAAELGGLAEQLRHLPS